MSHWSESSQCKFTVQECDFHSGTKLILMSCKGGKTVCPGMDSLSWESGMGSTCVVFNIQFSGAVLFNNYFVRFLHWILDARNSVFTGGTALRWL